jgi:hypothetical protein
MTMECHWIHCNRTTQTSAGHICPTGRCGRPNHTSPQGPGTKVRSGSAEDPQVYYKAVQDARLALISLNEIIDGETLIRHGLNQFKEHLDLKYDVKAWKKLTRTEKTWKRFKAHFTRAINENKNDTGTLKAIGIANAVKEQINENKEHQQILAQAADEANEKIDHLEKLYTALLAKQPQQQQPPPQDKTAETIRVLTDKINRLELSGSGSGSTSGSGGTRSSGSRGGQKRYPSNGNDGIRNSRRYDNYCWTCGFDIKHNSMTCQYINRIQAIVPLTGLELWHQYWCHYFGSFLGGHISLKNRS